MATSKSFNVAIVGATGLVGQEMRSVLDERALPINRLVLLASARSVGESLSWRGQDIPVQAATAEAFAGIDIVLMSAGSEVSRELAPAAAAAGAVVIDNSAAWRNDAAVPLVVPEVNAADVAGYGAKNIIANPNCSTIQMMVALGPLHAAAQARRVVVATYQAVSGAGKEGLDELGQQVTALFNQAEFTPSVFTKQIAFNCVPHIDRVLDDGYTAEERKMRDESRRILHAADLGVCATCVRVPVFNGHALSITAEFENAMTAQRARDILRQAKGVLLEDDPGRHIYPTQVDAQGSDATHVGRLRDDPSAPHAISFWCVADNLRKGAATNAVQIAEILIRDHLR
jgi:aspartate-semialdehyde dehydrogenase